MFWNKKTILLVLGLTLALAVAVVKADFTLGEPVNLRSVIPGLDPGHASVMCFSYNGLEMYFYSDQPGGQGGWDLWVLKRSSISSNWGPPENLGPAVNSPSTDEDPCISADGLALYFGSGRSGADGPEDVYVTTRTTKDAPWGPPVNLGSAVNSAGWDGAPWISPDGLELYFRSIRPGGYGSFDIYVARRATTDDTWGEAATLGPVVNSPHAENYFSLSPDGLLLLFSDQPINAVPRPGGYGNSDMWMTRRASLSSPWQAPTNLGSCVNSSMHEIVPRISPDGSTLYFLTRDASGTWENWQAPIIPTTDFNGDGQIDGKDVLRMAGHWGAADPLCDIGPFAWGDGTVGLDDLIVLAEHIGPEVTDPTLIAHWALDETEGMLAADSIGENTGIVFGNAVWQPEGGQAKGCLAFDGIDDMVIFKPVLNPQDGPFSALAWVQGGAPGQVILSQQTGVNWLQVDADGTLMTELRSSGEPSPLYSETVVTDGNWHHIGFVWDGTQRMLYVDDVAVALDEQSSLGGATGGLVMGVGTGNQAGTFWSGLIDDVRVYDRVVAP